MKKRAMNHNGITFLFPFSSLQVEKQLKRNIIILIPKVSNQALLQEKI